MLRRWMLSESMVAVERWLLRAVVEGVDVDGVAVE